MTPREFADFLKARALGEANAWTASRISEAHGFSLAVGERELRALAELACIDGLPVCSSNRGYYWPKDKAELYLCIERLDSQAKSMLTRCGNLRKSGDRLFGPPDLFPQARGSA